MSQPSEISCCWAVAQCTGPFSMTRVPLCSKLLSQPCSSRHSRLCHTCSQIRCSGRCIWEALRQGRSRGCCCRLRQAQRKRLILHRPLAARRPAREQRSRKMNSYCSRGRKSHCRKIHRAGSAGGRRGGKPSQLHQMSHPRCANSWTAQCSRAVCSFQARSQQSACLVSRLCRPFQRQRWLFRQAPYKFGSQLQERQQLRRNFTLQPLR